jgi:hypothetical protein
MVEKENAQNPADSTPAAAPPPIQPQVDPPPIAQGAEPEGEQPREKMSTSDWIMSIATVVIALGTIVSAAAIGLQWREMVNGGADTAAIKVAAQKQADAAQHFADTAASINAGIGGAVEKLDAQSRAAQETARIVISDNRPWIVPDPPPQHKNNLAEAILDWHNVGQSPAVDVFSYPEYFVGDIPKRVRTCRELERDLKRKRIDTWQYQSFVDKGARYQVGLSDYPGWNGQSPIGIHGCIWYRDVLSNAQRTTEFFYIAFQGEFGFPKSEGITLFYLADHPIIYR